MAQNQDPQEHILIALNNETGQMGAVVGQNPDGTPRTADIKSTPITQFVCFNKQQNPIEWKRRESLTPSGTRDLTPRA